MKVNQFTGLEINFNFHYTGLSKIINQPSTDQALTPNARIVQPIKKNLSIISIDIFISFHLNSNLGQIVCLYLVDRLVVNVVAPPILSMANHRHLVWTFAPTPKSPLPSPFPSHAILGKSAVKGETGFPIGAWNRGCPMQGPVGRDNFFSSLSSLMGFLLWELWNP